MSDSPSAIPPSVPNMVLVGASGRNSGKTTLACRLIQSWQERWPVIALKVVSVGQEGRRCHRGHDGCGLCTDLSGPYRLTEETDATSPKDTAQMLRAGAKKSFLLVCRETHLPEGFAAFLQQTPPGALLVCESNTLRKYAVPGVFLFANASAADTLKPSAHIARPLADGLVTPGGRPAEDMVAVDKQANGSLRVRYVP